MNALQEMNEQEQIIKARNYGLEVTAFLKRSMMPILHGS